MKDINTIQSDPRWKQFQELACQFQRDYDVRVWHSNVLPCRADPNKSDIIEDFYKPLERFGLDLNHQVYCYGSPK